MDKEDKDEKKEISDKFEQYNIAERKRTILIKFLNKIEKRKKIKKILGKREKLIREFEMEKRREIEDKKQREFEFQKRYENEMNKRRNQIEQNEKESQLKFENEMNNISKEREYKIKKIKEEKEEKIQECYDKFQAIKAKLEELKNDKEKFFEYLKSFD